MSSPLIKGASQRTKLLVAGAQSGIRLQCEGGVPYDRHMRRLVSEGLMKIIRPRIGYFRGGNGRMSKLVTTHAGIMHMNANNIKYEAQLPEQRESENTFWHPSEEGRSILVDGNRRPIYRLELSQTPTDTTDYHNHVTTAGLVVQSFKSGRHAYHWNPTLLGVDHLTDLVPAGILRKTGCGLTLDKSLILHKRYFRGTIPSVDLTDCMKQFRAMAGHDLQERAIDLRNHIDHFLIARNAHDFTVAKMMFSGFRKFEGYDNE